MSALDVQCRMVSNEQVLLLPCSFLSGSVCFGPVQAVVISKDPQTKIVHKIASDV